MQHLVQGGGNLEPCGGENAPFAVAEFLDMPKTNMVLVSIAFKINPSCSPREPQDLDLEWCRNHTRIPEFYKPARYLDREGRSCFKTFRVIYAKYIYCLLYTSPSPRDGLLSRMPSSA